MPKSCKRASPIPPTATAFKRLFDALLDRAVEPFETVYAEVAPGNTSKMAERLPLRGFKEEARSENGTIEFKLTREIGG
jgi:hypothetical protein